MIPKTRIVQKKLEFVVCVCVSVGGCVKLGLVFCARANPFNNITHNNGRGQHEGSVPVQAGRTMVEM